MRFRLTSEDANRWSEWSQVYSVPYSLQWFGIFYREIENTPPQAGDDKWKPIETVSGAEYNDFTFTYSDQPTVMLAVATSVSPDQQVSLDTDFLDYGGVPGDGILGGELGPNSHTLFTLGPLDVTSP